MVVASGYNFNRISQQTYKNSDKIEVPVYTDLENLAEYVNCNIHY